VGKKKKEKRMFGGGGRDNALLLRKIRKTGGPRNQRWEQEKESAERPLLASRKKGRIAAGGLPGLSLLRRVVSRGKEVDNCFKKHLWKRANGDRRIVNRWPGKKKNRDETENRIWEMKGGGFYTKMEKYDGGSHFLPSSLAKEGGSILNC